MANFDFSYHLCQGPHHPSETAMVIFQPGRPSVEPLGELPHVYALSPVELDGVLLLVEVEAAALPGEPLEAEQGSAGRCHLKRLQLLLWEIEQLLILNVSQRGPRWY